MEINVKQLRISKGLTQEEVAKFLGVTKSTLSKKENGQLRFSLTEGYKLSRLFGVDMEDLFETEKVTQR